MRVALAQINTTVGAIEDNRAKIVDYIGKAKKAEADIVVFPELALSGYPPEDLLFKKAFLERNRAELGRIVKASKGIFTIVGFPDYDRNGVYNGAALIYDGGLIDVYRKIILPNYGVFDEKRYFLSGNVIPIIPFSKASRISVSICEDIWHAAGPHRIAARSGRAKIIINISASPYHDGKKLLRYKMLKERARENRAFICYCNLVGGQDELVFDGSSLVLAPSGGVVARGMEFEEDLVVADLNLKDPPKSRGRIERGLERLEEVYTALVLGLRDYVRKNGFSKVVLGLSGGIDSALTAAIARDALGSGNVAALSMPSQFTSAQTKKYTRHLAANLGIRLITMPIDSIYKCYLSSLEEEFKNKRKDILKFRKIMDTSLPTEEAHPLNIETSVTEENLQARIRGNLLMAFSNKFGWLVVTTGNKSEISVGYCTLYGDMAGGFAVLKDVPKTMVYKLAGYVNKRERGEIIPRFIIKRAPTAELKKNQKDQDTLPPYPALDKIIDAYVERDMAKEDVIRSGLGRGVVNKVISMIDKNEYKRRQSPPGVKITPKAFGKDRRMPITNTFL